MFIKVALSPFLIYIANWSTTHIFKLKATVLLYTLKRCPTVCFGLTWWHWDLHIKASCNEYWTVTESNFNQTNTWNSTCSTVDLLWTLRYTISASIDWSCIWISRYDLLIRRSVQRWNIYGLSKIMKLICILLLQVHILVSICMLLIYHGV